MGRHTGYSGEGFLGMVPLIRADKEVDIKGAWWQGHGSPSAKDGVGLEPCNCPLTLPLASAVFSQSPPLGCAW